MEFINAYLPNFVLHENNSNLAKSVMVPDTHCLDGTLQRIWLQKSTSKINMTKWYFHLEGGGWCKNHTQCLIRSQTILGSSDPKWIQNYSDTMDFADLHGCNGAKWCGGLILNDPSVNPVTWDWNKAFFQYCDGGSFSGNRNNGTIVGKNKTIIFYQGFQNLNKSLMLLMQKHNLGRATEVIVGGGSAGGLATYMHTDHIANLLPATHVVGVPDSGFFFQDPHRPKWSSEGAWIVDAMNSTVGLHQGCLSANIAKPEQCFFPEIMAPYIHTRLFTVMSKYDTALGGISLGSSDPLVINQGGQRLIELVNSTLMKSSIQLFHGAFINACHRHCGEWATGYNDDANATVDGISAMSSLHKWYSQPKTKVIVLSNAAYPCDVCCTGGDNSSTYVA